MRIIAGFLKGRPIQAPKTIRPTSEKVRGAVFNMVQGVIDGAHFLDLFAGSGAMSFEAASRGAGKVVAVESHPKSLEFIKKNEEVLKSGIKVMAWDATRAAKKLQGQLFDIIYIDPPYSLKIHDMPAGEWIAMHAVPLLKPEGLLFIEDACKDPYVIAGLSLVNSRHYGTSHIQVFKLSVVPSAQQECAAPPCALPEYDHLS